MGFKDLKLLFDKKSRIFLVCVLWLLISFTVCTFIPEPLIYVLAYVPLLIFCIYLFMISFLLRKDLKTDLTKKNFFKYVLISIPFIIIFSALALVGFFFILIISILSYIFITTLFTSIGCFEKAVDFDEKLYKFHFPINFITRSAVLLGGLFLSAILMLVFWATTAIWALTSPDIVNAIAWVPLVMILISLFLTGIAFLFFIFMGKYNAWLGIFYVWISIYAFYLMISAFMKIGSKGGVTTYDLPITIALYVFDLIILLYTISGLVGEKADVLSEKLRFIKPDAILIWLIFSKAAYEFTSSSPESGIPTIKAAVSFLLFVPLFLFMGLYGMSKYFSIKKERKTKKKAKKKAKKDEKASKKKGADEKIIEDSEEPIKKPIFCSECGTENKRESTFCRSCGAAIKK